MTLTELLVRESGPAGTFKITRPAVWSAKKFTYRTGVGRLG